MPQVQRKPAKYDGYIIMPWGGPPLVEIDIYLDHVMIEGQRVNRPSAVCRYDWNLFWNDVKRLI